MVSATTKEALVGTGSPTLKTLSKLCFVLGFISIAGSIAVWAVAKEPNQAHGERFGIFIGLWAPTFFILSNWFSDRFTRSRE